MNYLKSVLLVVLIVWVFGFIYVFNYHSDDKLLERLEFAENKLKELERINKNNELWISNLKRDNSLSNVEKPSVAANVQNLKELSNSKSLNGEELRRKIYTNTKDLSYYAISQIDKILNDIEKDKLKKVVNTFKDNFNERINLILSHMYNYSNNEMIGHLKAEKANELKKEVLDRFNKLQNPTDCANARFLICDLNKGCGFGCQMHHVMYCFIDAYFQNRTMILESYNWRYDSNGYTTYFKPATETCKDYNYDKSPNAVRIPIIDARGGREKYLPLAVPKDLAPRINEFHGNPFVWWAGQILSYLMRFQPAFEKEVNDFSKKISFKTPCVGIHVRRTDKIGTEASFHHLSEYMKHAQDFFDLYTLTNAQSGTEKHIYLASDEIAVLDEAVNNFKDFKFSFDRQTAQSANLHQRYSPESLRGVIMDIYHLSQCEFLVCTFSSQVCRMAYELMQMRYVDASWRFRSLDDIYYFGGQNDHEMLVVNDHIPQNNDEIELKIGDKVSILGDHWNGYSKARNLRTNQVGLFPSYKIQDIVKEA